MKEQNACRSEMKQRDPKLAWWQPIYLPRRLIRFLGGHAPDHGQEYESSCGYRIEKQVERLLYENSFATDAVNWKGMTLEEIEIALATNNYSQGEHKYQNDLLEYPADIWVRRAHYVNYDI